MKLESLNEFIVFAHYLNFTSAANNLHISQPNLSKHLAELEKEVGTKLISRGKNLQLTPAGEYFLKEAVQIHHGLKEVILHCREVAAQEAKELVIQEPYIIDSMGEILLKSVMRLKREQPYTTTRYYTESGKKSIELLESGKIDIALFVDCSCLRWIKRAGESRDLVFYPIVREPLLVWMHESNRLAEKESLCLADLLKPPINIIASRSFDPMRFAILGLFENALGTRPNLQSFPSESLNEFFLSTQDGSALFLVSPAVAESPLLQMQKNRVIRPIDDPRAFITSYLVFKRQHQNKTVRELLDIMTSVVEEDVLKAPQCQYLGEISPILESLFDVN